MDAKMLPLLKVYKLHTLADYFFVFFVERMWDGTGFRRLWDLQVLTTYFRNLRTLPTSLFVEDIFGTGFELFRTTRRHLTFDCVGEHPPHDG